MELTELFDFYVPDVDFHPRTPSRTEKSLIPAAAGLMIGLFCLVLFCKVKHRWLVNAKCSFCKCIARVWRGGLHWWFCNHCKRINGYPKKSFIENESASWIEKSSETLQDLNYSNNTTLNVRLKTTDDNNSPVEYTQDNSIFYVKNNLNKSPDDIDYLKILHKKMMQDDMKMRLELLNAEKKLCSKTKQVQELEKTLRDVKGNVTHPRSSSQSNIFNKSIVAIRRRSSFFSSSFNLSNSFKDLNTSNKKRNSENDQRKIHLTIEEQLSELKKMHLKEITSLTDKMNEKKEALRKLEELNENVIKLHQQIQENVQLQREETETLSDKLQELNSIKRRYRQIVEHVTDLEDHLLKELDKIRSLKSLLEDFQSKNDMSAIKEESVASGNTSTYQHEIFKLNEELVHCKEENERLTQDNAQLRNDLTKSRDNLAISSEQVRNRHYIDMYLTSSTSSLDSHKSDEPTELQQRNDVSGAPRHGPRIVKLVKAGQRPNKRPKAATSNGADSGTELLQ